MNKLSSLSPLKNANIFLHSQFFQGVHPKSSSPLRIIITASIICSFFSQEPTLQVMRKNQSCLSAWPVRPCLYSLFLYNYQLTVTTRRMNFIFEFFYNTDGVRVIHFCVLEIFQSEFVHSTFQHAQFCFLKKTSVLTLMTWIICDTLKNGVYCTFGITIGSLIAVNLTVFQGFIWKLFSLWFSTYIFNKNDR